VELPGAVIDRLVVEYAGASGRDIKELLKLTSKYCRRKELPLSAQSFAQCAVFRGIACASSQMSSQVGAIE
jgi:hypothetical protein